MYDALPVTNIFAPMAAMERELAALQKRVLLAETVVTTCHSAMLGKVSPKHPAWSGVYAVQDAMRQSQPNVQGEPRGGKS